MPQNILPSAETPAQPALPPITPAREPRPLISEVVRKPGWLWLSHVVPAGLLLLSLQYTYSIVGSELSPAQRSATLAQAIVLAGIGLLSATLAVARQRRGTLLSDADCGGLLIMAMVTMGIGYFFNIYTIPQSLPEWIASREELFCRFFCLAMPGAFYPLLILSARPMRRHSGVEFVLALCGGAICVGAAAVVLYLSAHAFELLPDWAGVTIALLTVFLGGSFLTAAVTRTTLIAYTSIRQLARAWQQAFMFVIAVAGPIGGLYLNRTIPFPTDFQAPIIYILALVNGGVLMLPAVRSVGWHRAIWLAQCVMFPFSAYFLVVFLPWMPLSPFALIAAGAGFLMLVPLVLGLVHGYRVIDGYREEVRDGARWKPALAGMAAALVLPTLIGGSMWQDRRTLDQALDYIYAPDYRADITFPGDTGRLRNSLQHLRDMKHGIFLPFISPAYNAVVFHGLVLPDAKIDYLQTAFFGDKTAAAQTSLLMRGTQNWDFEGDQEKPPTGAVLQDVKVATQSGRGFSTSHLTLQMYNPTSAQCEYVTRIHLPEGVYVSNFAIYNKGELVPARIVEKKTALWVYEKIAVGERRDPGLLIYKTRTELELRLFPFAGGETRQAELELTYPDATPVSIAIGDRTVPLNQATQTASALAVSSCTTPTGSVAIADGAGLAGLGLQRKPYLHVLIDCSAGWGYTADTIAEALQKARHAFPGAEFAKITAVNYEARDVVSDLTPVGQLDAGAIAGALLPFRGGFLEDRFLKRGLLLDYDAMQKGMPGALLRPQFVVISRQPDGLREDNMENFLRLVPDARVIYLEDPVANVERPQDMATHAAPLTTTSNVVLWQWADHYAATPAADHELATFPGGLAGSPQVYDPAAGQFIAPPAGTTIAADSRYADGVRTWAAQDESSLDPSLLRDGAGALLGLSKQTRILIPDSSYIAVETTAQWRALEEKEKEKLANKQVFEIEEPVATPEPATWLMLVLGLTLMGFQGYRRRAIVARARACPGLPQGRWRRERFAVVSSCPGQPASLTAPGRGICGGFPGARRRT